MYHLAISICNDFSFVSPVISFAGFLFRSVCVNIVAFEITN